MTDDILKGYRVGFLIPVLAKAFITINILMKFVTIKIILHRIISVVGLTSFLPETWTRITHDEESKRLTLSVKQSLNGLEHFIPVQRH